MQDTGWGQRLSERFGAGRQGGSSGGGGPAPARVWFTAARGRAPPSASPPTSDSSPERPRPYSRLLPRTGPTPLGSSLFPGAPLPRALPEAPAQRPPWSGGRASWRPALRQPRSSPGYVTLPPDRGRWD